MPATSLDSTGRLLSTLRRFSLLSVALVGIATLPGCKVFVDVLLLPSESVAGSLTAIGGSITGISVSSGSTPASDSSSSKEKQEYVRDLRQYAAIFVRTGGTQREFERGLSQIAETHGITHWEGESATPFAIGQGLAEAGIREDQMAELGASFAHDPRTADWMMTGWRARAR